MNSAQIGDVFADRYELQALLGQGGFATVFRARDRRTQRDVVLKVLSPDLDGTYPTTMAARFQREAQILAALNEPHIVTMYDFGRSASGLLFMVFEFVAGRDLGVLLQTERLSPKIVQRIVEQLLEALREAHRHGVLHRDLKPANVLVYEYANDPYRVKLIDFGIAKDTTPDASRLTKTGNVVGTLRYMAPEQIYGEPVTPATDIFALGMIGWEMLMGRPLIGGMDRKQMLQEHASLQRPMLPPIPEAPQLREAILRALEPDAHQRLGSADAMLAVLRTAIPGAEPAPVASPEVIPQPSARRRPVPPWLALVAVGGVAAVTVVMWSRSAPEDDAPVRTAARDVSSLTAPRVEEEPEPPTANEADVGTDPAPSCVAKPSVTGPGIITTDSGAKLAVYIPARYDPADPPGLVLGLHRRLRDGKDFINYTEIGPFAEKHNWIVVAPESDPLLLDWSHDTTGALDVIDYMVTTYCIDRTKLHIIGDEGGASYARRIACAIPVSSVISTFAPGALSQCDPEPVPYMRIYTLQDKFHPSDGRGCARLMGDFGRWHVIDSTVRGKLSCDKSEAGVPWSPYEEHCRQYKSCEEPLVICGFDGGHRWPASPGQTAVFFDCKDDPETRAPLMQAAAQFMVDHGRSLTPAQIARGDHLMGRR